ncbi:flagellar hook-basal body complex protein FliE [Legionella rowbothamii]|uniref:flagellar hook-basal body complex protein FliE n=1 Tax=Legionella rowbothamii TaxID=96229 RepID=UPI001056B585|nr:flagellar hook-basal body complex protein FliE [Legionella rowbothamii]
MRIDALDNLFLKPNVQSPEIESTKAAPQESFSAWISEKIDDTNTQLNTADKALNELASGHAENLHQTMITLEQAKLSFQYLEQIRNRLMSAYQDLLREQI